MKTPLSPLRKLFAYLLFFISGFCALVYEVVWSRMLVLVMGNTTLATTTILTAFMAGLSLGGLYWGSRVDKARRSPLFLFGCLETGVAISASVVSLIIRAIVPLEAWISHLSGSGSPLQVMTRFFLCFCVLIVPTFLMGGTLAVIGRHVISREGLFTKNTAILYGVNTAGSFAGAFLAGFFLIKLLGHSGSLLLAAALNLAVGIFAVWAGALEKKQDIPGKASLKTARGVGRKEKRPVGRIVTLVLIALGISGFCAIAYQIIWTRLLILTIDNSVYSFTIILMGFLAGIALGSFMLAGCYRFVKSPILLFAVVEVGIGVSAFCFPFMIHTNPNVPDQVYLKFLISSLPLGILVPTVLMGIAFPVGARIYQQFKGDIGRSIGVVYAVNTAGCVLGGLSAGFILIGSLGFRNSILLLSGLNLTIGALIGFLSIGGKPRYTFVGVFVLFFVSAYIAMPSDYFPRKYATLDPGGDLIYYKESVSTTATVFERPDKNRALYLNGIPEVDTSYLSIRTFKLMGALPGLLHEKPEDALMITFGAGIAAGTAILFADHLDCVDLASQARDIAPYFETYNNRIIQNSGISLYSDDARHFLQTSRKRYSIIISDATHPRVYDSWVLFTQEFYRIVRNRLSENGIFLQWLPFHGLTTDQYLGIVRTFSDVFEHTSIWRVGQGYTLLLATPDVLEIDWQTFQKRVTAPDIRNDLKLVGLDNPFEMLSYFAMGEGNVKKMLSGSPSVMTDNSPAHLFFPFSSTFRDQYDRWPLANYEKVKAYEESVIPFLANISEDEATRKKVEGVFRYYKRRGDR